MKSVKCGKPIYTLYYLNCLHSTHNTTQHSKCQENWTCAINLCHSVYFYGFSFLLLSHWFAFIRLSEIYTTEKAPRINDYHDMCWNIKLEATGIFAGSTQTQLFSTIYGQYLRWFVVEKESVVRSSWCNSQTCKLANSIFARQWVIDLV